MKDKPMIGYARVSTDDQDLTNQRAELHAAGCTRIFAEKITGTHAKRPELGRMLDHLRAGDVVTVTRLDRLARSTRDLLDIAEQLQAKGAGLRSLAEPWADTTTPAGRMVLTVFAGIAEFERSLIIDRTRNGREAAKARGVKFGPRPTLTPAQIEHARELIDRDGRTVKEAAELLAVHRSTLYRALARGEEVKLSGFGVFSIRSKNERLGRNPRNGEPARITPRKVVVFRASRVLKSRVAGASADDAGDEED